MHVELYWNRVEDFKKTIDCAKQRGLDGIVFALSKKQHEKYSQTILDINNHRIPIFFSEKIKANYKILSRTKHQDLVLFNSDFKSFLPDREYTFSEVLRIISSKKESLACRLFEINRPQFTEGLSIDKIDGMIMTKIKDSSRALWYKDREKPVYGGSGEINPERIGTGYLSKFSSNNLNNEIIKGRIPELFFIPNK